MRSSAARRRASSTSAVKSVLGQITRYRSSSSPAAMFAGMPQATGLETGLGSWAAAAGAPLLCGPASAPSLAQGPGPEALPPRGSPPGFAPRDPSVRPSSAALCAGPGRYSASSAQEGSSSTERCAMLMAGSSAADSYTPRTTSKCSSLQGTCLCDHVMHRKGRNTSSMPFMHDMN